MNRGQDRARLGVEAELGPRIPHFLDGLADDLRKIDVAAGGDFTGDDRQAGGDERFTRNASSWIDAQCRVKYSIRDLVRDFVWMAFSNGLRGKQITGFASQTYSSFMSHRLEISEEKDRVL